MTALFASGSSEPQTLVVFVPIREGEGPALERALERREAALVSGLRSTKRVHSARLFLLPSDDGAPEALVLETRFDGSAREHRRELVEAVGEPLLALVAHGEGSLPSTPADLDAWLVERGLRLEATCSGHDGLTRAIIENDARLDAAVQGLLDAEQAAGRLAGKSPLALAEWLRARLAEERELGVEIFRLPAFERDAVTLRGLARQRPFTVASTLAAAPFFALRDRVRREHETAAARPAPASDRAGQNALIHVARLRPGKLRRSAVHFALACVHDLVRARRPDALPAALGRIHCAAWTLLPGERLLFTMTYDGSFEVLGPELAKHAPRAIRAIWGHTEGFGAASCLPLGGGVGIDGLRRFARAFEVPAQIWYSAYPDLTVADVLRNHHLRELLASDLDAASASALSALL
ncbi:MAG: hypothetical protein DIU78_010475 [Pseudomonadota bacterium]